MPIIGLVIFFIDIAVILDIFKSSMEMTHKLLWTLLVVIFPVVGAIIYYIFGRNNKATPTL